MRDTRGPPPSRKELTAVLTPIVGATLGKEQRSSQELVLSVIDTCLDCIYQALNADPAKTHDENLERFIDRYPIVQLCNYGNHPIFRQQRSFGEIIYTILVQFRSSLGTEASIKHGSTQTTVGNIVVSA